MVFTAPRVRRPNLDVTAPEVAPALGALAGRWSIIAASLGVGAVLGCSAPPGADLGPDGPPSFGGLPSGAGGASAAPGNPVAPSANTVGAPSNPTPNGEQNPATNAPIAGSNADASNAGSNADVSNGAGGASMAGSTPVGAAGSSMGVSGSTGMPPAEPPADPTPAEITQFFAQLPCGAKYTAMGDGSYSACVRLVDGGAACTKTSAAFTRVTFSDGTPVTDVAQVSGMGENAVGVVTIDGALHMGNSPTTIDTTPLIASGVVNISGGRNARVALVTQGTGFGILGWQNDAAPSGVTLPGGEQPVQVSANYGLACALATTGAVFCWQQGANVSVPNVMGQTSPVPVDLGAPVRLVSAGQDTLCGVTFDDTLTCTGEFNASPYLPTQRVGGEIQLLTTSFPSVREVHAAFHQGTIVRSDGSAFFLPGVGAGENNPGQQFTGATNVVASGGDRATSCVVTTAGEVFCMFGAMGGPTQRATIDGAPLVAQAAQCPF